MSFLTQAGKQHLRPVQASAPIMSDEEVRRYSLRNVLLYLADPGSHKRSAGLELEISSRGRDQNVTREHERGIFVPFSALARDLTVGAPTAGGNLVATEVGRDLHIGLLRPASQVIAAGATVLTHLQGNLAIPRMTGGATVAWVAENAAPSEGNPSWDQVSLSPKTAAAYVDIGRRLGIQTGGDVSRLVAQDLVSTLGTAIDAGAIRGTGSSNEPRGILSTVGIGSVAGGTNGAAPTYDHVVDLEAAVANQNTLLEAPGYLTNSRVRAKLEKTQMFGGTNGVPVWVARPEGDTLKGRPARASNNVPNTLTKGTSSGVCSAIVYGNWSDLLIGLWGQGVTLLADPFTFSTTGALRLVVMVDVDVGVRYPTSFAAMADALTT